MGAGDITRKIILTIRDEHDAGISCVAAGPDCGTHPAVITYSTIRCQQISSPQGNAFWNAGIAKAKDLEITFYEISNEENEETYSSRGFVATLNGTNVAFLEARQQVTTDNKESLVSTLEMAEEVGCSQVIACISKEDANSRAIAASLMATGFSVVDPRAFQMPGFILLAQEL